MAANPCNITVEGIKILSFLRQNIVRKICEIAAQLGLPKTHPQVLQRVVQYFNLVPVPHQVFDRLIWRLAHTI